MNAWPRAELRIVVRSRRPALFPGHRLAALIELLGLAAFVLFLPMFRSLPDAGFGVAKTLGLTVSAFACSSARHGSVSRCRAR